MSARKLAPVAALLLTVIFSGCAAGWEARTRATESHSVAVALQRAPAQLDSLARAQTAVKSRIGHYSDQFADLAGVQAELAHSILLNASATGKSAANVIVKGDQLTVTVAVNGQAFDLRYQFPLPLNDTNPDAPTKAVFGLLRTADGHTELYCRATKDLGCTDHSWSRESVAEADRKAIAKAVRDNRLALKAERS